MDMSKPDFKLTKLNEKAMLVKLTRRRPSLVSRDEQAENFVRDQLNDESLMVNSKLFRDPANPVNQIMQADSAVYTYHKKYTTPYVDKGPRILPNAMFMEYMQNMREHIRNVDVLMNKHMPNYDTYVQNDIAFRTEQARLKGVAPRATVDDYPTAAEFRARMSIELVPMPLPDRSHFLFDVPDEELQAFQRAQDEAASVARVDAIRRMLDPVQHLVAKLALDIGEKGSVFRDSAIENIIEGVELARKLNIDADPAITDLTRELLQQIAVYDGRKEWLRESPVVRKQAHDKLAEIANKMGAWMQGA